MYLHTQLVDRTQGLLHVTELLYQLSHIPGPESNL